MSQFAKLETRDRQTMKAAISVLLLALVTWISYFHHFRQFSLYYEDYMRIPTAMQWNWAELWDRLSDIPAATIAAEFEGRPLHPNLIQLFTVMGESLGGLSAIYLIAYLINLVNVLLFFWLMWRSSHQPFFTLTSALAFALFPVNTNHAWLTSALGILPALTLLLVALHLYLTSRRNLIVCSYFIIFISLFCYEKFLPLFWAAPLLKPDWNWNARSQRELIRHTALLMAMLFTAALIRRLNGESRVRDLDAGAIAQVLSELVTGPFVAIATFIRRPIEMLFSLQSEWLISLSLLFIAIGLCLHQAAVNSRLERTQIRSLKRLAIAGLAMLSLAYLLTFTDSIYWIDGRDSHVHIAAIVGASILCGWICSAMERAANYNQKRIWSIAVAGFFTLLIAFGFAVQADYVASTQYQRSFWTNVSKLCPDMTRNTLILVEFKQPLKKFKHMSPLTGQFIIGQFPRILGYLYRFPADWTIDRSFRRSLQPKIYQLSDNWRTKIALDNQFLRITSDTVVGRRDLPGKIKSADAIFLEAQDNQLLRHDRLLLNNQTFPLKQNNTALKRPPFEPNVLYDDLIIH